MTDKTLDNIWRVMREYKFELEHDINTELKCVICMNMLINACNGPCGCRYCMHCIDEYLKADSNCCPGKLKECKEDYLNFDKDIQIDRVANLQISRVKVKCPEQSCRFVDELRNIEYHMRVCDARGVSCPYMIIGCSESKIPNDHFQDHLSMDNYSHTKLLMEWIENVRNEIEFFQRKYTKLETENDFIKKEKECMNKKILELQTNYEVKNEQIKELQDKLKKADEKLNELQIQLKLNKISVKSVDRNSDLCSQIKSPTCDLNSPRTSKSTSDSPKSSSLNSGFSKNIFNHRINSEEISNSVFYSLPSDIDQTSNSPEISP